MRFASCYWAGSSFEGLALPQCDKHIPQRQQQPKLTEACILLGITQKAQLFMLQLPPPHLPTDTVTRRPQLKCRDFDYNVD